MWSVVVICIIGLIVALNLIPLRFRLTWQKPARPRVVLSVAWPMEPLHIVIRIGAAEKPAGRREPGRRPPPALPVEQRWPVTQWIKALSTVSAYQLRLIIQVIWIVIVEGMGLVRRAFRIHRLIIEGEYGGQNPAITGQVYGLVEALAGGTGKWLTITMTPNFLEPGFMGSFDLIGSILLYRIFWFPLHVGIALFRRLPVRVMLDILGRLFAIRQAIWQFMKLAYRTARQVVYSISFRR